MGLIDGWCGSECHGVVINTCQCQPMHPSLMCEEQSHGCSTFALCPIQLSLSLSSLYCLPHELCVGFVGVCCVMSCDGVRCEWCSVSRCPLPKKAAQHTALFACDGVHQCVMLCDVYVCVCVVVVVWWVQGKKGRGKDSQTKTKRTFPKTTFSLFPFFHHFFFHSFLLAFHSSTVTPFLSTHSPVFHASHMGAFMVNQKHQ